MAKRIGEMLKTSDPIFWMSARFKGDHAVLGEWWQKVMEGSESNAPSNSPLAPTDFEFPQEWLSDIPSDEPGEQVSFVEPEPSLSDPIPTSVWEESAIPDTENSSAATPTVEPERVLTEVSPEPPAFPTEEVLETALRERFSPKRFERAMVTLERTKIRIPDERADKVECLTSGRLRPYERTDGISISGDLDYNGLWTRGPAIN